MTNTYRATSGYGRAHHGEGVFEAEFTAAEEADLVPAHAEIVPRTYRVTSNNYSAGEQGSVVELALPVENEAALISGGHLERVDNPKPKSKPRGARGSNQNEEE